MMNKVLIEAQYFPPIAFFAQIKNFDEIIIEQQEHYVKRTYRNRCHIAGANGVLRLSVPLQKGKNEKQAIKAVQIAYDTPWQSQHWQSIRSAYGKAPFFEHYADHLESLFLRKEKYLFDLNILILEKMLPLLKIKKNISFSDRYIKNVSSDMVDARNSILPHHDSSTLTLNKYNQLFEDRLGFIPNLSILDGLFCMGSHANSIISF